MKLMFDTRTGIDPLVTGYRIIVTVVVASIGMTKSALLYRQEPMEATTVECVFGVGIVTEVIRNLRIMPPLTTA